MLRWPSGGEGEEENDRLGEWVDNWSGPLEAQKALLPSFTVLLFLDSPFLSGACFSYAFFRNRSVLRYVLPRFQFKSRLHVLPDACRDIKMDSVFSYIITNKTLTYFEKEKVYLWPFNYCLSIILVLKLQNQISLVLELSNRTTLALGRLQRDYIRIFLKIIKI